MKVILISDVSNLGRQGAIVDVKRGYARNHLLPKNLAWEATPGNLKRLEQQKRIWEVRMIKEKEQSETLKALIEEKTLHFTAKVGEEGHLYGSITAIDIAEKLEEMKISVDKRRISLPEPIKREGSHDVVIKLHHEVDAVLKVEVTPESEE